MMIQESKIPNFWTHVIGPVPYLSDIYPSSDWHTIGSDIDWKELHFARRSCIKHRYTDPKGNSIACIHCQWEEKERDYQPEQAGIRYLRRQNYTLEEIKNLHYGKCFCGKPKKEFKKYMKLYCCKEHSYIWYLKNIHWQQYRERILHEFGAKCNNCGYENIDADGVRSWKGFDVDHILAIINGGHQWDKKNLQVLCTKCHKIKTKRDMKIYRMSKKELVLEAIRSK